MDEPTSMSQMPQEPGDLQFDRVEPAGSGETSAFECAFCHTPLYSNYYEINGKAACEACRYRVEQEVGSGAGARGFWRALLAGCAAAAVGSGIYYGVRALTGYEIGLVAILVGFMVGKAVRWGTGGRGGRGYQALAVFLTYMSIASTFLPAVIQQMSKDVKSREAQEKADLAAGKPAPQPSKVENRLEKLPTAGKIAVAFGFLFVVAAMMPVLVGFKSPILLLIIGFGLWEAWKINRRLPLIINGPLQVGRPRPAAVG